MVGMSGDGLECLRDRFAWIADEAQPRMPRPLVPRMHGSRFVREVIQTPSGSDPSWRRRPRTRFPALRAYLGGRLGR